MKKDLVIGGIGGYEYHQIENWVNSLNKSGFDGDKILELRAKRFSMAKIADMLKVSENTVQNHIDRNYFHLI